MNTKPTRRADPESFGWVMRLDISTVTYKAWQAPTGRLYVEDDAGHYLPIGPNVAGEIARIT